MLTHRTIYLAIAILLILAFPTLAADYKSGEVIVKFKSSPSASVMGLSESRPYTVEVDDTEKALAELNARGDVEYAEPNYVITAEELPNDWPYTSDFADTGMSDAFAYIASHAGGATVRIAVVDSGVDLDHGQLSYCLIQGYDFANNDNEPEDDAGHGTEVCGVIAAKGNDSKPYAGVAWDVPLEIMPLKFMKSSNGSASGNTSDAVRAIYYAVDNGAKIINASWGFTSYSNALEDAIKYAQSHGVLFIASAGNEGKDNDTTAHYPSNYTEDNVIAVAAMNRYDELASFSNYGKNSVHIAAPGSGLKSTTNDGGTSSWISGTSFAAPWVAGVAAMVISQNPTMSYSDVRSRLLKGSIMDSSYGQTLLDSGGCINAYNALAGITEHAMKDTSNYTPPQAQVDTTSTTTGEGGGGGGGGCFIQTATPGFGPLLFLGIMILALFRMRPPTHQD